MKLRAILLFLAIANLLGAQGNGKLQLHFIDVGQGDGALLISPGGQAVAFDIGEDLVQKHCDKPVSYYEQLGIAQLAYLFVSHYHQDHIGCVPSVLQTVGVTTVEDRGKSYQSSYYDKYIAAIGDKRHTGVVGDKIILDMNSANPVTIEIIEVDARGIQTSNENDLSLSARVSYGAFRAEIGGDLSGDNTEMYVDVESTLTGTIGKLDLYKVHHHCSSHSSNDAWLAAAKPTVAIISAGTGNAYGHPTVDCLERLHSAGTRTYWTETGAGVAEPVAGWDVVAGNTLVQVDLGTNQYAVSHGSMVDTYAIGGGPINNPSHATFAWSKNSNTYHYSTCDFVKNISPANLQTGNQPPNGKVLHANCPRIHQ